MRLVQFLSLVIYSRGVPNVTCDLCGITVERSLAIQKVAGLDLGRSSSR